HLLRSFIVSLLVIGLACTLALLFPRPISEPADPFQLPDRLQSTWIVVDVTRALIRYLGAWGLGLFTLLGIALALIPLFDRAPERRLRRRPVAAALGVVFFTGFLVAWFLGRGIEDVGSGTPVDRGALDAEGRPTEIVPADTAG
ncbi:MAG: hypothetical protein GWN99_20610, partial [Gemmatimonadetes bacterium]|nr:hypothetical protein [Gemmatimonadota bacterium]NIS03426.1 hypothetical protein [Gemmatimonadota bacterium]NIT68800.1 hypothetical protein [Gemmatimonadota bacterium]NIU54766.1 hypothetical protein [Gemmatimonadota bacterium]NIV25763.1 hypothetical protein [Gemmatimonadota bacterium]